MEKAVCVQCGSENIMVDLKIVDHGHGANYDLAIEMHRNPDALIFKKTQKGTLMATVCGSCGKVELSIDNPQELWEIYKQHGGA